MPRRQRGWSLGRGRNSKDLAHTPLSISLLEPALLVIIKNQAKHGYTMLSDLEKIGISTIHPSVVYRTLRELENLTWIKSDWETDQTQGPPRRIYQITPQGVEALDSWIFELHKANNLITTLINQMTDSERS